MDPSILLQVNLKAHHVEYNNFYIPDITTLVDIQEDYLKWFLRKADIVRILLHTGLLQINIYEFIHLCICM